MQWLCTKCGVAVETEHVDSTRDCPVCGRSGCMRIGWVVRACRIWRRAERTIPTHYVPWPNTTERIRKGEVYAYTKRLLTWYDDDNTRGGKVIATRIKLREHSI